ncbi:ABC transporter F family member 1 [Sesbania bispinosa]|nr:ABC transporter F family member 1 [Sesbania bispinosa]
MSSDALGVLKTSSPSSRATSLPTRISKTPRLLSCDEIGLARNMFNGIVDIQIFDRTCTCVLCSYPLSRDIRIESPSVTFHGHDLIADSELELNYGRRYGLLGLNGFGNSNCYAMCSLGYARKLFEEMSEEDEINYGSIISGYMVYWFKDEVVTTFRGMENSGSITWNVVISANFLQNHFGLNAPMATFFKGLQVSGRNLYAQKMFEEMPKKNVVISLLIPFLLVESFTWFQVDIG